MNEQKKLRIAVFGAGHLGKIHIRCLLQSAQYNLVGFYEPNQTIAEKVAKEFNIPYFSTADELIALTDVVDIVTPTFAHFDVALQALKADKHVFIEKPVTQTVEQAERLLAEAEARNLKIAVGHVERFNPALLALKGYDIAPKFIEAHRLSLFNARGTDVSVVLDLMIHDLDIVLHLMKSKVKTVQASGVAIVSSTADMVNARLEFENGSVANLTASRFSLKQMRKVRVFQADAYISMDFLEKKSEIINLFDENALTAAEKEDMMQLDTPKGAKFLKLAMPTPPAVNAILTELDEFAIAIIADKMPAVSIHDGLEALRIALMIEACCV
ncbi:MAG: hypothetical protein RI894_1573 [Bacteroidota bacterium]|jgi:predicted dehydrogenase